MPAPKKPPLPPAPGTVYIKLTYQGPVLLKGHDDAVKWRDAGVTVIPYDMRRPE